MRSDLRANRNPEPAFHGEIHPETALRFPPACTAAQATCRFLLSLANLFAQNPHIRNLLTNAHIDYQLNTAQLTTISRIARNRHSSEIFYMKPIQGHRLVELAEVLRGFRHSAAILEAIGISAELRARILATRGDPITSLEIASHAGRVLWQRSRATKQSDAGDQLSFDF